EVAARHRQRPQPRGPELRAEAVALALVEGAEALVVRRILREHLRERVLGRGEGAEGVVLVHLAELGRQRGWRDAVADLPAGAMEGLAEAGDDEGALAQRRIRQRRQVPSP